MKKILGLLFLLIIFPIQSVFATADNSFATTELQKFVSVLVKFGTPFGFNIANYIHPEFEDTDQIATTKYKPFADFKEQFSARLLPGALRQEGKIVDWDDTKNPIIWTSLYCAVLKASSPNGEDVEPIRALSNGAQKSSNVPDAARAYQHAVTINSMIGLFEKTTNEQGKYDFNQVSHIVANMSNGDCYRNDPHKPWDKIANDQTALSKFGDDATIFGSIINTIVTEITKLINGILVTEKDFAEEYAHQVVVLTEKKKTDHSNNNCHDGATACPENDIDSVETKDLDKKRGWAAGFTPEVVNAKPVEPNGGIGYRIKVFGMDAGRIEDSDKDFNLGADGQQKASCMAVPAANKTTDFQARAKIGKEVSINEKCRDEVKDAHCPIDVIEQGLADTSPSCGLKNTSGYTSLPFVDLIVTGQKYKFSDSLPNGIPPLMQKVLEAAGSAYNVPASVLLGTMLEEGSFNHAGTWDWTDEKVREFSDCTVKDPMTSCNEFAHPTSGSKGAFGFLQTYWDNYMKSDGPYKALLGDSAWKSAIESAKPNYSQCNFVDAAFTAARELGEDQSHYQPAYVPVAPQSCTIGGRTFNTNIPDVPSSCSDWSADRVAMARLQYGNRVCDEGINRMVITYEGF